ncbi:MAG: hypothetical protein ACI4DK_04305 [Lachnospiraceae bacterium]
MNKNIEQCFHNLIRELRINSKTINFIKRKQIGIEKQIKVYLKKTQDLNNRELKNISSYFAGSYGRGTEINTSDIDLVLGLPIKVFKNIRELEDSQSYWLNEIACVIKSKYTSAQIEVDGQVVSVNYGKIKFEVLPAFINRKTKPNNYIYADINNGGQWRITDPRSDAVACNELFDKVGNKYKEMCWLMRQWRDNCNVEISGIIIDCNMYNLFSLYTKSDIPTYDILCLKFFEKLSNDKEEKVVVPGSNTKIIYECKFQIKAKEAYEIVKYAITFQELYLGAIEYWQVIFGEKFNL